MSSRALRRLRQEQLEATLDTNAEESEEEEEEEEVQKTGFLQLDSSEDESSEDESSDDEDSAAAAAQSTPKPTVKAKPAKVEKEEDIDTILSSFQPTKTHDVDAPSSSQTQTLRNILLNKNHGYDIQALDLDYAVKSLLGGVGDFENYPRGCGGGRGRGGGGGRRTVKKYLFGRPRESWGKPPSFVGGGLGCKELTEPVLQEERNSWTIPWPYNLQNESSNKDTSSPDASSTIPKQKWYTLTMADTYQDQQYAYHQLLRLNTSSRHSAAALEDPNTLAMFVADHPHYADTLLQLSMVLYHVNDRGRGGDLLRRCMYVFETALPSSVLPNSNDDGEYEVLMDVDRQPNQGLFAALFRIMQTSGMSGCHPNALMTGRFLLSLDPLRDPMGVLLILDYYALASRGSRVEGNETGALFVKELVECDLIKVHYKDPLTSRHWVCDLKDMPGWAFSYALALYRLANNDDCEDEEMQQKADDALVDALTKFPLVLPKLLAMNKVNTQDRSFIMDWPKVLPFFTAESDDAIEGTVQDRVAKGAGIHLVRIFVQRHHKLWAGDNVIQWMFKCADMVVDKISKPPPGGKNEEAEAAAAANAEDGNNQAGATHLTSKFHPSLVRYAQFDPSEYEDAFRTLPPEAIALDPNIIAPAMEFNANRRGRFLRRAQLPEEMMQGGREGLMMRLVGDNMGLEMLDPDSPLLQLYLQSLLPWNQVDGVAPPR
ncbi:hypothetical protein ACHAWO_007215 [Cyclotella atomus]|uniref:Transcription factor 25 n=1 Tax=Cyclotella atomus TaxID=382360 RepID=A0ABD3NGC8_9STRA